MVDPAVEELFKRGMDQKYNTNYRQEDDILRIKYGDGMKIKGVASHAGALKAWATIPGNAVHYVRRAQASDIFDVEKALKKVAFMGNWKEAVDFIVGPHVYTIDQDLV